MLTTAVLLCCLRDLVPMFFDSLSDYMRADSFYFLSFKLKDLQVFTVIRVIFQLSEEIPCISAVVVALLSEVCFNSSLCQYFEVEIGRECVVSKALPIFQFSLFLVQYDTRQYFKFMIIRTCLFQPKPRFEYTLKAVGGSLTAVPGLSDMIDVSFI